MTRIESAERMGATVKKINSPKPHRPKVENTINQSASTGEATVGQVNGQAIEA
jgi:hypothetical protein